MKGGTIILLILLLAGTGCRKASEVHPTTPPVFNDTAYSSTPYNFIVDPSLKGVATYFPADNPMTVEGIKLGRYLFYDSILSEDYTLNCGSCHQQKKAFSDAGNQFSNGVHSQVGTRNTMALFNLAFQRGPLFWDGRAPSLEAQILVPVAEHTEMNLQWDVAVDRVGKKSFYNYLYRHAFGKDQITKENLAKAVAQFLRTIVSFNSPYYRSHTSSAGQQLFNGQPTFDERGNRSGGFDCLHCHNAPTFQNEPNLADFVNNGVDTGQFRIPSLRNIMLTAPYMHDGRFKTIDDVLSHYDTLHNSIYLDRNMWIKKHASNVPKSITPTLSMTKTERKAVIDFLKTLTDDSLTVKKEYSNPFRR